MGSWMGWRPRCSFQNERKQNLKQRWNSNKYFQTESCRRRNWDTSLRSYLTATILQITLMRSKWHEARMAETEDPGARKTAKIKPSPQKIRKRVKTVTKVSFQTDKRNRWELSHRNGLPPVEEQRNKTNRQLNDSTKQENKQLPNQNKT